MITHSRAFIFDMDGTLVDNMSVHLSTWQVFLAELGVHKTLEELKTLLSGRLSVEILPLLGLNFPEQRQHELIAHKEEIYRDRYRLMQRPIPGLEHFLSVSRRLGVRLAVATAAPPSNIDFTLGGLSIDRFFDAVVGAQDVARGKPEPDLFLEAARRLDLPPSACLVFEDSLLGLEAARRAGMRAVAVATMHAASELEALPHVVAVAPDYTTLTPAILLAI